MPQQTVTKEPFDYAGRSLKVGDTFECEEGHVELLSSLGYIRSEGGSAGVYTTREMKAGRSPRAR